MIQIDIHVHEVNNLGIFRFKPMCICIVKCFIGEFNNYDA
nr:MAG TPA: hypothetical protein [Caudoviricetes sp.]